MLYCILIYKNYQANKSPVITIILGNIVYVLYTSARFYSFLKVLANV